MEVTCRQGLRKDGPVELAALLAGIQGDAHKWFRSLDHSAPNRHIFHLGAQALPGLTCYCTCLIVLVFLCHRNSQG